MSERTLILNAIILLSACALACSSGDTPKPEREIEKGSEQPTGVRLTEVRCTTEGAYQQAQVIAVVEKERPAIHECVQELVSRVDPATGTRVTSGDLRFAWDRVDGLAVNRRIGGAGDSESHACVAAVVARLEETGPFEPDGDGKLECRVSFARGGTDPVATAPVPADASPAPVDAAPAPRRPPS